jgi:thioredoxin reductase
VPVPEALRRPNIEVLAGCEVKEVLGAAGITALVVECDGIARRIDVDRAFVDLGLVPHSDLVKGLVATDPGGFIVVDDGNETTLPGLFAAGDVTTSFCEQVLIAVGDGVRAAVHAYDYLLAHSLEPIGAHIE